jgi:hypothetical protein
MKKNFVTFLSPGTFMAESTTKEIEDWDVEKAKKMAKRIVERYGAKPYGFYFTTREREEKDFDSKETKKSGLYYLKARVLTLDDLKDRNNPDDRTLICNMESNKWEKIVENCNGYKWTQPLEPGDTVLEQVP